MMNLLVRISTLIMLNYCLVNPGDRIAQLIIEQISMCPIEEVEELPNTARYDLPSIPPSCHM